MVSAYVILGINLLLAVSYRSENSYLQGARWGIFVALGLMSWARHSYWFELMFTNYKRISDFESPLGWHTMLCQASAEVSWFVATTSLGIVLIYLCSTRWPEWTDRWRSIRTGLLSSSLGLQCIFVVSVVYPTPAALVASLYFASIISPILRRQVRFNHVVFLCLVPLFSLGSPTVALIACTLGSLTFFYFAAIERSLTRAAASVSFFVGAVFSIYVLSSLVNRVLIAHPGTTAGLTALAAYVFTLLLAYGLIFRGQDLWDSFSHLLRSLTPALLKGSWWDQREEWVDREIYCRENKLYRWKDGERTIGTILFGHRSWAPGSENYPRVQFPKLNFVLAAIALALYSLWFGVDAVLHLTTGDRLVTVGGLLVTFIFVMGVPAILFLRYRKDYFNFSLVLRCTTALSMVLFSSFMVTILYAGLVSGQALQSAANSATAATAPENNTQDAYQCPCELVDEGITHVTPQEPVSESPLQRSECSVSEELSEVPRETNPGEPYSVP